MTATAADKSRPKRSAPSLQERCLSGLFLLVLAIIALSIVGVQSRFDPSQWRAQPGETEPAAAANLDPERVAVLDRSAALDGLQAMSPPEYFDPDTLSDKINGKAELYLSSGFKHLEARRLSLANDPGLWAERFVYDMGVPANAFAVYSQQRRDSAQHLDLTPDAYQSANGIFFVQGNFYVEIIGSDSSPTLLGKLEALARAFVELHPMAAQVPDERTFLPKEGRESESVTLTASNAFGFEAFDQIYSARYQWDGLTAIAYVSRRSTAAEAAELVDSYVQFLVMYGGKVIAPPEGAPSLKIIEIMDWVQIVFSHGDVLAGVHEADDLEKGLLLATQLLRNLNEEP